MIYKKRESNFIYFLPFDIDEQISTKLDMDVDCIIGKEMGYFLPHPAHHESPATGKH